MKNKSKISGMGNKSITVLTFWLFIFCLTGCGSPPSTQNSKPPQNANSARGNSATNTNPHSKTNASKEVTHEHHARHGGTLVELGEEYAHLEIVVDSASGQITAYALDGEAENSQPIAQPEIEITITKPKSLSLKLQAQENTLTGEKRGATSEFRASSEELKNLKEFEAKIVSVTIRSREFKNINFNFPKGN